MPVLRPFTTADLDDVVTLQREGAVVAFAHIFPQDLYPFPSGDIRDSWLREVADPGIDCFVAVHDGRVAGYLATRGPELLHFGTAIDTWGSGLADRAHAEGLDHLRRGGHMHGHLICLEDNHRARAFYERRGWIPTDTLTTVPFPPHPPARRYEIALA